jgi:hypothetical protein
MGAQSRRVRMSLCAEPQGVGMHGRSLLVCLALVLSCSEGTALTLDPNNVAVSEGSKTPVRHELGAMVAVKAPVNLATTPVTVRIAMNKQAGSQIAAALTPTSKTKLVLSISGIDFDKRPEIHYQVYLNLPKGEKPDYKSVYFIGNLSFFSFDLHGNHSHHAPEINFDITQTVRSLRSRNLWGGAKQSVTFVTQWLVDSNENPLPVPPGVRVRFTTIRISAIGPEP